jgi:hypothetical protein
LVFSAFNAPIGRPASRQALRDSLLMQAVNFHGERCGDLAVGVRVVEHFRSEVLGMAEPEEWRVQVPLGRPCLIDALMGMTRATPGRGSLLLQGVDSVRLEHQGSVYEYVLAATGRTDLAAVLAAPEEQLFVSSWRRGADK